MSLAQKLEGADSETLREIIREAESYLSAQLTVALAADQRAVTLCGMLAAASAILASGGISLIIGERKDIYLGVIGLIVVMLFMVAMILSISAAKPCDFNFVGTFPSNWEGDILNGKNLDASLAEQASHYDLILKKNNEILKKNGSRVYRAIIIAWGALLFGVVSSSVVIFSRYEIISWILGEAIKF